MRLLAMSDIHSHLLNLKEIVANIDKSKIDATLIAGDLTNYGNRQDVLSILEILDFAPVLGVPGNLDNIEVLETLEERNASVHASRREIKGTSICGFGGGLPFNPGAFLHSEFEIKDALGKLDFGEGILLTHMPAKGLGIAKTFNDVDLGSEAIREAIIKQKPRLLVCGHVHEASGIEKLANTTCINVASVKDGRAAIIDIEKSVTVEWIQL